MNNNAQAFNPNCLVLDSISTSFESNNLSVVWWREISMHTYNEISKNWIYRESKIVGFLVSSSPKLVDLTVEQRDKLHTKLGEKIKHWRTENMNICYYLLNYSTSNVITIFKNAMNLTPTCKSDTQQGGLILSSV